ncbi:MAG: PAS domain-containing protein [bacterium]|nr:PAS domain-containing protein [bacterium]
MGKNKKTQQTIAPIGADFIDHFWEKSWAYIKTVVDVVREPVLVLDKDLRVMTANESFYRIFQTEAGDTEQKIVYELGNGQWNIPALRKLLEDILPKNTFFKGFEVIHEFPLIGRKTMILNARQIHTKDNASFPPIILLAIEDVTEIMDVAEMLAYHTKHFEVETAKNIKRLEVDIKKLNKKIGESKRR